MEAVAYRQQENRFNELRIGKVYLTRGMGFQPTDMPPQFGLAITNRLLHHHALSDPDSSSWA
jgi:hypothetical protein